MNNKGRILVDGDIVAYRAAASLESKYFREVVVTNYMKAKEVSDITAKKELGPLYKYRVNEEFKHEFCAWAKPKNKVYHKIDVLMDSLLLRTTGLPFNSKESCITYLTGSTNFRKDVSVTHVYKGTRAAPSKPYVLSDAKEYMTDYWDAVTSIYEEADDLLGKAAAYYNYKCVVASIDKDMLQLPCWHFNLVTFKWTSVSEFEGLLFFYTQMLTGDAVDNIKGISGIGPKIAEKLLSEAKTEQDMYEVIHKAYKGDVERITENGRLLWLRRQDLQMWKPPSS